MPALDRYLREQAGQDARRRMTGCYVALLSSGEIGGFYTLAMGSVSLEQLPEDVSRRLPRYPNVPTATLGRLATHSRHRGLGLGRVLLWDAVQRVQQSDIMASALIVDAKDDRAREFYGRHGFDPLVRSERSMFFRLAGATP